MQTDRNCHSARKDFPTGDDATMITWNQHAVKWHAYAHVPGTRVPGYPGPGAPSRWPSRGCVQWYPSTGTPLYPGTVEEARQCISSITAQPRLQEWQDKRISNSGLHTYKLVLESRSIVQIVPTTQHRRPRKRHKMPFDKIDRTENGRLHCKKLRGCRNAKRGTSVSKKRSQQNQRSS
eukprot:1676048-Rhodomonas_salina.1